MNEKAHIGLLFDRIANSYDRLNHLFSLNIDRMWRRQAVKQLQPADHVLDVAVGTADLAIEMLQKSKAKHVIGLDLSKKMMAIGEQKCKKKNLNVHFLYANAQQMPFDANQFDLVTCAYGCRNFQNLDEALAEMFRVLKPGGHLLILEFSYPSNRLIRALYDIYFTHIMPTLGRWLSKDKTAYTYLNHSVKNFCWGRDFVAHLEKAGFIQTHYQTQTFGISTIYTATKE